MSPAMSATLAAAPIVLILSLMLLLRWSAVRAGLAGLGLATGLALTLFEYGQASPGFAASLIGVGAESSWLAATILLILLPALALHEHQMRIGAVDTLRLALGRLSQHLPLQVLLVAWFAALFFEGAAGFGTPVALTAPLLVALGLAPVQAVVLALLGHAIGVSFGALGTPVMAQVGLTGIAPLEIAWRTAALHASLGGLMMFFFVRALATLGAAPGWPWAALAAAGFLLPYLLIASMLGPELPTLGGALLGALLFAMILRYRRPRAEPSATLPTLPWRALAPYAVLVVLVLCTRTPGPLGQVLAGVELSWQLPGDFKGSLQPLRHPGVMLLLALLIGARLQGVTLLSLAPAFVAAARRLVPVTVALLAMLGLSRLMLHAGMIDTLEQAAVSGIGQAWPLIAPAVGALGSFVTGSATASNILFTTLQAQTAEALGLAPVLLVAAQCFGAAVGNIVCPHNVIAGAATVGLAGREGEVLRRTVGPCLIYLACGGLLVSLIANF